MKLSTKLILSFSFVGLLLAGIGVFSQYYSQQIKNQLVEESENAVLELTYSGEMGLKLYHSLLNAQYFLDKRYNQSIPIDTSNFQIRASTASRNVKKSLDDFSSRLDSAQFILEQHAASFDQHHENHQKLLEILQQLEERFNIYRSLINQLFELASVSFQDGREFLSVTVEPYFRSNMIPLIEQVRNQSRQNMDEQIEILNSRLDFASTMLAIATVTTLLIAVFLAMYLYRSIATPLRRLSDSAKQIGEGNLDERIQVSSSDEIGELASEFNRMAENLSKITFSKEYVDNIIESMADALVVTDSEYRIKRVNTETRQMLGYQENELLGEPLDILFSDVDEQQLLQIRNDTAIDNFELSYRTSDDHVVPVSFSKAVMRNADGSMKGLVCLASDITDRKKAEEQVKKSLKEKEILLAEIHHRVKNNLAVISGMLQMQIWETENEAAETALRDSQLRVQSIALVHEKLYQSENLSYIEFDKYIRDLLQAIGSTYMNDEREISITTELDTIALNINQAIPCSLLINELVVNAYKHAFTPDGEGQISIEMKKENGHICVNVRDNGSGFPEEFADDSSESLGMSIINTLSKQLNADIRIFNNRGANVRFRFKPEDVF
ncbi:MAG: histidine kinase dimerization/phosphoacceptor domain -containing protein [Balneolaceae bacterium]|nr:histidine kinase dimerization/phosphoacceptor domain -containing protein [Balneolaceae bacterium]